MKTASTSGLSSEIVAPSVLVLGASGFIGRALVNRLLRDGIALRALVRGPSAAADWMNRAGVDCVGGDLNDMASLEAALTGVQHVYHLARSAGRTWDECLHFDVEPTRRLAESCATRGVVLHFCSSIAIYDGGQTRQPIDEATPPSADSMRLNPYARAKVEIERFLGRLQMERGLKYFVYRPGIVIGAGGEPRHPGVGAWPSPGVCRPWGGGRHPLPFVLVDDCADAMALALHRPELSGASFNLIGSAALSGDAYLNGLEKAIGLPIKRLPLPAWRLFAQSGAKWVLKLATRQAERPMPSYRYVDGLSCRAIYVADRAKQQLGWQPVADTAVLEERGIVQAVARAGYLRRTGP